MAPLLLRNSIKIDKEASLHIQDPEKPRSLFTNSRTSTTERETAPLKGANQSSLSWRTRIGYSFGHFFNDLCAAIWFSYTLLYFQVQFNAHVAGALILLGQVADALSTPFIGYESDKNGRSLLCQKYGRRMTWHLIGTVLVLGSFPFIYSRCLGCEDSSTWSQFAYFSFFIVVFQFGWAAVQVAHMSLITDLSPNSNERVLLNSLRQAATVAASVTVYSVVLVLFGLHQDQSSLSKEHLGAFTTVVYIVCVVGSVFSLIFHMMVREPPNEESNQSSPRNSLSTEDALDKSTNNNDDAQISYQEYGSTDNKESNRLAIYSIEKVRQDEMNRKTVEDVERKRKLAVHGIQMAVESLKTKCTDTKARVTGYKHLKIERSHNDLIWSDWLFMADFWKVGAVYMFVRLFINLTQVYTPLYLKFTLRMPNNTIAIIPFVTYVSGFIVSLMAQPLSSRIGSRWMLLISSIIGAFSCIWIYFGSASNEDFIHWQIFAVATLFGVGGTVMLISSLALTADLIGSNRASGAFVFGAISFLDKVINGAFVVAVQEFNPNKDNPNYEQNSTESIGYYRIVMSAVAGLAIIFVLGGLASLTRTKFQKYSQFQ